MTRGRDRETLRWGSSLGIVLFAHIALFGATLFWRPPRHIEPPVASAPAVMVDLAPMPSAPPAPPTELPPAPPQRERPRNEPPPEPRSNPDPPRTPPTRSDAFESQPTPERPAEPASDAGAESTAPPSVQAPPAEHYAARESLAGATAARAMVVWQAQLLGHLQRFKRYPRPAQRRRQQGTAQVRFSVDRQGHAHRVAIARTTGHAVLDQETLATVRRADPLPPPPPEIAGETVEVVVPVEFFLVR